MLNIVFENDQLLVVDKPSGLVVNKSETVKEKTLQDRLGMYLKLEKGDLGIGDRAGIVHRLDRETSGLVIVGKTTNAFEDLQAQFKNRQVKKKYLALVHGKLADSSGVVDASIVRIGKFGKFGISKSRREESREAQTEYRLIKKFVISDQKILNLVRGDDRLSKGRINYLKKQAADYSFVEFYPKTGRTHQIRVHAKHIGHPVVSDLIYTPSKLLKFDLLWCPRLFLHAAEIEFTEPGSGKKIKFESKLPADLEQALDKLEKFA